MATEAEVLPSSHQVLDTLWRDAQAKVFVVGNVEGYFACGAVFEHLRKFSDLCKRVSQHCGCRAMENTSEDARLTVFPQAENHDTLGCVVRQSFRTADEFPDVHTVRHAVDWAYE